MWLQDCEQHPKLQVKYREAAALKEIQKPHQRRMQFQVRTRSVSGGHSPKPPPKKMPLTQLTVQYGREGSRCTLQDAKSQVTVEEDTLSLHGRDIDSEEENKDYWDPEEQQAAPATTPNKNSKSLELWSLDKALMGTITRVTEERVILS